MTDQLAPINRDESQEKIVYSNTDETRNNSVLEVKITQWIERKGFVKQGLTIEELAVELISNRTYISSYINSTYGLSFREWIAQKRIDYSKELLRENCNKELRLNKIADMVGYSSTAFNVAFTKINKMTPSKWRSINCED